MIGEIFDKLIAKIEMLESRISKVETVVMQEEKSPHLDVDGKPIRVGNRVKFISRGMGTFGTVTEISDVGECRIDPEDYHSFGGDIYMLCYKVNVIKQKSPYLDKEGNPIKVGDLVEFTHYSKPPYGSSMITTSIGTVIGLYKNRTIEISPFDLDRCSCTIYRCQQDVTLCKTPN